MRNGDSLARVVCQNSVDRLGGPPCVVVEDPAQPLAPLNRGIHIDRAAPFLELPIVEPLTFPLNVIMLRAVLHRVTYLLLIQRDDLGQAPGLEPSESCEFGLG